MSIYVTPYTCVVVNVMGHEEKGRPAMKSVTTLKNELQAMGYLVNKVRSVWNGTGYQSVVLIEFGKTDAECISAVKLQTKFDAEDQGWIDWDRDACLTGCFLWLANPDDARHFKNRDYLDYEVMPIDLLLKGQEQAREDNRDVVGTIQRYFDNLYD